MHFYKKVLSAVMSLSMAGTAIIYNPVPLTMADDLTEESVSEIYDTTKPTESKEETTEPQQTTESPFRVFDIYNAYMGYNTSTTSTTSTTTTTATETSAEITTTTTALTDTEESIVTRQARGIDVSQWQSTIDWETVKDAGVEFAIMRAGYGKEYYQEDPTFDYNMQKAQENSIACGAYWYSYATDVESAKKEAEVCYSVIKDYDFKYPIYFDIEDEVHSNLSTAQISAITEAFCSTLADKGYRVGIYSYANFLSTKIYSSVLDKYDVWVAHFNSSAPAYNGKYDMWQYSATGRVDGISGDVDLDVSYVNYPYIMSPDTYVHTPGTTFDYTMTNFTTTTTTSDYLYKGIDVSIYQGDVDWKTVKESGVDYAIIRAGYGRHVEQKDEKFEQNMEQAKANGIDRGVYWYSYADTVEAALMEAKACCEVIEGYQLEYPVYFDIEDKCFDKLSNSEIRAITDTFCKYMEEQGYCCGVTSYSNFLRNRLGASFLKQYAVWIAHYNVREPSYGGYYGMWQYSCQGSVDGINGPVDLDYAYVDYPSLMIECHRNGY
ncbi:MAG: glycoside hydrolase family 25 protein [Ruminococcus sp.]|nr:glycoside hydrolase family 25 protein [Ruminococcus sp.]